MSSKSVIKVFLLFAMMLFLAGCSGTIIDRNQSLSMPRDSKVLVVPFENNSDTPDAGKRASAIVSNLLKVKGFSNINQIHQKNSCDLLNSCKDNRLSMREVRKRALKQHAQYIVSGFVNEWRYKVGLDGEPSVGSGIVITDVLTGDSVFTVVGSRTGHSWSGLSDTAQKLFKNMLSTLYVRS